MIFNKARLVYETEGIQQTLTLTDATPARKDITLSHSQEKLETGLVLQVQLTGALPLNLVRLELEFEPQVAPGAKMLVNGFQTWTQSREFGREDYLPKLGTLPRPLLAPYGDYTFSSYSGRQGRFHSWSWTGFNDAGNWLLLGACDEDAGYTRFDYDFAQSVLKVTRDCQGVCSKTQCLKVYIGRGSEQAVWDEYSALLPQGKRRMGKRCTGWTSWYNYYTKIDEPIIKQNIQALADSGHPFDVFQIDDGWQQHIGDWLHVNHKFPAGMDNLAQNIRAKGFRPGLWLAPFICEKNSKLWQQNNDWVLKDKRGKPVRAGWNPGWSGWFYALDFYAPGFQNWLKEVFRTVFIDWGYQMVKLDFLYAVALLPHHGRSRGQIMTEAMEFIHQVCAENWVLGCGVPLGPAVGKVDYCRIGSDVAPYWEDFLLGALNYRERVSTINSLYSTLHRHMLDGRLFRNDPDVFILRDGKRGLNENKLTPQQRHTLFLLNNLLGGLVFLSDNISEYNSQQRQLLSEMFPSLETKITHLSGHKNLYTIEFQVAASEYVALANLTGRTKSLPLPPGDWFHPDLFIQRDQLELGAHQTLCLRRINSSSQRPWLMGSSGHLWPGAQVSVLAPQGDGWRLELAPHAAAHTKVWIGLPQNMSLAVNNKNYPAQSRDGYHYIII